MAPLDDLLVFFKLNKRISIETAHLLVFLILELFNLNQLLSIVNHRVIKCEQSIVSNKTALATPDFTPAAPL